jgi:hypothetical protein
MRTVIQSDVFIQLIATHKIKLFFISEMEEGAKGKISERQERAREREQALGAADLASDVKWTVRKYTCLINKMVNIWNDCY